MKTTRLYIVAGLLLWLVPIAMYLWPIRPPIESFGEDTVTPSHVKAGDTIVITRNWRATRNALWVVTRAMVRGDCRKSCDIIDMPSSTTSIEAGTYVGVSRPHVVPLAATPGVWTLRMTIQWDTPFWGTQKVSMPPLTITVVEP